MKKGHEVQIKGDIQYEALIKFSRPFLNVHFNAFYFILVLIIILMKFGF